MIALETPFWNKVDVDHLTVELLNDETWVFIKVYTNDVNIYNEKIKKEEVSEEDLQYIVELGQEVKEAHILEDWELFKELSRDLMTYIKEL